MASVHLIRWVLLVAARQWAVEFSLFALAGALLLSAELLSATATSIPDAETLPSIYFSMVQ
jgi:hypothetical protein